MTRPDVPDRLTSDLTDSEYYALKAQYTKEAKSRHEWQKFSRFRQRLVERGCSQRDAWLTAMQEWSIEFDLQSPLPPLIPIENPEPNSPRFKQAGPTGKRKKSNAEIRASLTLSELNDAIKQESMEERAGSPSVASLPVDEAIERARRSVSHKNPANIKAEDLKDIPVSGNAWDDLSWVYSHFGGGEMPDLAEHPPPSRGAIGLWDFAKADPSKFYTEYYKAAAKNQEEDDAVKSIEADSKLSAKQITRYIQDVLEESERDD